MNGNFFLALVFLVVSASGCSNSSVTEREDSDKLSSLPTVTRPKATPAEMEPARPSRTRDEDSGWAESVELEIEDGTPKKALRTFLKAMAIQDLDALKSICMEHRELKILVSDSPNGEPPTEYQKKLMFEMGEKTLITSIKVGDSITRLSGRKTEVTDAMVNEDRKLLTMPGNPVPFPVYRIEDGWKVDPSAIITVRKTAARLEKENSQRGDD